MPEKYPAEEWQEEIIGRFYDKNFFLSPVAKENPSAVQTPADKIQRSIFNFVRLIYSTVRQTVTPKITIISITNNFSGLIFRQNNVFFYFISFFRSIIVRVIAGFLDAPLRKHMSSKFHSASLTPGLQAAANLQQNPFLLILNHIPKIQIHKLNSLNS